MSFLFYILFSIECTMYGVHDVKLIPSNMTGNGPISSLPYRFDGVIEINLLYFNRVWLVRPLFSRFDIYTVVDMEGAGAGGFEFVSLDWYIGSTTFYTYFRLYKWYAKLC